MILVEQDIDAACDAWTKAVAPNRTPRSLEAFISALSLETEDGSVKPLVPTPAQRAFCRAWDRGHTTLVILGSVQSGKTFGTMVVPTLYQIAEDRRPVIVAGPDEDLAKAVWRGKGDTTLRASGYGDLLPKSGGGARGGVPDEFLTGRGCRVYFRGAGGGNEGQQASLTARAVLITEVDSIAISKKTVKRAGEAPGRRVIDLFDRRRHRYQSEGRLVLESTLKLDRNSLILSLWESGTGSVLLHKCPHCGEWTQRDWSHVQYDATNDQTALESARIACPSCGLLLTQTEFEYAAWRALEVPRGQHIAGDAVVGPVPTESTWSIRYSSFDDPATILGLLCVKHRAATIALRDRLDTAPMKQFFRDYCARPYDGEGAQNTDNRAAPDPRALAMRSASSSYDVGENPLPHGVKVFAVDQQERELWWLAASIDGNRCAVIDCGVEYICGRMDTPTPMLRSAALKRCKDRADAFGAHPTACGIDVGGKGYLTETDDFLRETRWQWWAIRGDGRDRRGAGGGIEHVPGWYERFERDDGRRLLMVESDTIKDAIITGLAAPHDSDVAIMIPRGLAGDSHLIRHLNAEEKSDGVWIKVHARNDLFDCLTYAKALARANAVNKAQDVFFS